MIPFYSFPQYFTEMIPELIHQKKLKMLLRVEVSIVFGRGIPNHYREGQVVVKNFLLTSNFQFRFSTGL